VSLDEGIRVTEGSSVVCGDVRDTVLSHEFLGDTAQLELSFFRGDSVDGESSLGVIQKSEGLVCGVDADDVLETSRVGGVSSDLSIDLDVSFLDDDLGLATGEGVLQSVSQQDGERETLSQLVGSRRGTRGKNSGELVQHPLAGSVKTL